VVICCHGVICDYMVSCVVNSLWIHCDIMVVYYDSVVVIQTFDFADIQFSLWHHGKEAQRLGKSSDRHRVNVTHFYSFLGTLPAAKYAYMVGTRTI
jgi:hypothetical protein